MFGNFPSILRRIRPIRGKVDQNWRGGRQHLGRWLVKVSPFNLDPEFFYFVELQELLQPGGLTMRCQLHRNAEH